MVETVDLIVSITMSQLKAKILETTYNSRRSGASYITTKYIYESLFTDKQEKRIKKINRINSKI
jgi:hypothetical protein